MTHKLQRGLSSSGLLLSLLGLLALPGQAQIINSAPTCGQNIVIPPTGSGASGTPTAANTTNATIQVSSQAGSLGSGVRLKSVELLIAHTFNGDLDITLISPSGQQVALAFDRGGGGDNFGIIGNCPGGALVFTDSAPTAVSTIPTTGAPTGPYRPEAPLSGFNDNSSPNGLWTLRIVDDASGDVGTLNYAHLTFETLCSAGPATLTASALQRTSAQLNFTSTGSPLDYTVSFTPQGGSQQTLAAPVTGSPVTLTNLLPGTTYTAQVQGNCASGLGASKTVSFTTPAQVLPSGCAVALTPGSPTLCPGSSVTLTTLSEDVSGRALRLDGTDDYVELPNGLTSTMTDFTFETWINYTDNGYWTRVMDFGSGTPTYLLLTPKAAWGSGSTDHIGFSIRANGSAEEQIYTNTVMPTGWHHLALTLDETGPGAVTGTIYLDGVAIGSSSTLTRSAASLGSLTQNWLGRSQYSGDAFLRADLDEVRIWNTARTASEIAASYQLSLAANTPGLVV